MKRFIANVLSSQNFDKYHRISVSFYLDQSLMLYTDRGVEYRGQVYQKVLKRHGIIHSFSRAGKCTDNAHMESFFHLMKTLDFASSRLFNQLFLAC